MQEIDYLRYELYQALDRNDEKAALLISQVLDEAIIKIMKSEIYFKKKEKLN